MDEAAQRAEVVRVARTYVGTRYHHNAKVRGAGVDCATLLQLVYTEAGVRPPIEIAPYSSQWHLHSDDPLYEKAIVANGGREIETPGIGDVALYFELRQFAHGAIVTGVEPLHVLHAYAQARRVLEGAETEFGRLIGARKKFYTLW